MVAPVFGTLMRIPHEEDRERASRENDHGSTKNYILVFMLTKPSHHFLLIYVFPSLTTQDPASSSPLMYLGKQQEGDKCLSPCCLHRKPRWSSWLLPGYTSFT